MRTKKYSNKKSKGFPFSNTSVYYKGKDCVFDFSSLLFFI